MLWNEKPEPTTRMFSASSPRSALPERQVRGRVEPAQQRELQRRGCRPRGYISFSGMNRPWSKPALRVDARPGCRSRCSSPAIRSASVGAARAPGR